MQDEKYDGVWLTIESGGRAYIGRYYAANGASSQTDLPDTVVEMTGKGMLVPLKPVYELIILVGPTPQGGIGKQVASTPVGICSHDTVVYVRADNMMFFSDMDEEDRRKYQALVDNARSTMDAGRLKERGIIIPAQSLPHSPIKTR
jgi:hypothetical protein